jgi:hypothetical protein
MIPGRRPLNAVHLGAVVNCDARRRGQHALAYGPGSSCICSRKWTGRRGTAWNGFVSPAGANATSSRGAKQRDHAARRRAVTTSQLSRRRRSPQHTGLKTPTASLLVLTISVPALVDVSGCAFRSIMAKTKVSIKRLRAVAATTARGACTEAVLARVVKRRLVAGSRLI